MAPALCWPGHEAGMLSKEQKPMRLPKKLVLRWTLAWSYNPPKPQNVRFSWLTPWTLLCQCSLTWLDPSQLMGGHNTYPWLPNPVTETSHGKGSPERTGTALAQVSAAPCTIRKVNCKGKVNATCFIWSWNKLQLESIIYCFINCLLSKRH